MGCTIWVCRCRIYAALLLIERVTAVSSRGQGNSLHSVSEVVIVVIVIAVAELVRRHGGNVAVLDLLLWVRRRRRALHRVVARGGEQLDAAFREEAELGWDVSLI